MRHTDSVVFIYIHGEYFIWHPRFFHKTSLSIAVQKIVRLQDSERAICTSCGKESQGFANAQKSHLTNATEYTSSIGIVCPPPWDPEESCHCGGFLMLKRRSCHQHQVLQFLFLQGASQGSGVAGSSWNQLLNWNRSTMPSSNLHCEAEGTRVPGKILSQDFFGVAVNYWNRFAGVILCLIESSTKQSLLRRYPKTSLLTWNRINYPFSWGSLCRASTCSTEHFVRSRSFLLVSVRF
jgi:hypothetical protein